MWNTFLELMTLCVFSLIFYVIIMSSLTYAFYLTREVIHELDVAVNKLLYAVMFGELVSYFAIESIIASLSKHAGWKDAASTLY